MKMQSMFAIVLLGTALSFTHAESVQSFRGDTAIDEDMTDVQPYQIQEGNVLRKNYRQQPPLIPHKIEKYQINLKANQCLNCHSWQHNADYKTVAAPESHFVDAQSGTRTDNIAAGRWFCTQCHVPQSNAPELIDNTFVPSDK